MRRLADRVGPTNLAAGAIVLREVVDDDFGRGSFDRRAVDLEVHFSFPALTVQERRIDERIVEWVASAAILAQCALLPDFFNRIGTWRTWRVDQGCPPVSIMCAA